MEIPKPLLLADVAVRVIWPPYDPLTRLVEKRVGGDDDGGNGSGPDEAATERLSTTADPTENIQPENNEV